MNKYYKAIDKLHFGTFLSNIADVHIYYRKLFFYLFLRHMFTWFDIVLSNAKVNGPY